MTLDLTALRRRWPADEPIQLVDVLAAVGGGVWLIGVAECAGLGVRRLQAHMPAYLLADTESVIQAARNLLAAAWRDEMARWQSQALEA